MDKSWDGSGKFTRIIVGANLANQLPCQHRKARWGAKRAIEIGRIKSHPAFGQSIRMRGFHNLMTLGTGEMWC